MNNQVIANELLKVAESLTAAKGWGGGRTTFKEMKEALGIDLKSLSKLKDYLKKIQKGGTVENLTEVGAKQVIKGLEEVIKNKKKWLSAYDVFKTQAAESLTAKHPLDGVRKHELMPKSIANKIPRITETENEEDPIVWVKFFSPYGRGDWYITEFDGRDEMFGWADLGHGELGYISLRELEGANKNGLPLVERDLSWRPKPLSKAK